MALNLPLPIPPPTLLDSLSRQGPILDAVTHQALRLGQRVQAVFKKEDDGSPVEAGGTVSRRGAGQAQAISKPAPTKSGAVNLADLIQAGLVKPGAGNLSVSYKGVQYTASLLEDGTIEYEGQVFLTASALSIHCKRLQTPNKQGDDGWKSVHYEGRALDSYRKQLQNPPPALSPSGQKTAAPPSADDTEGTPVGGTTGGRSRGQGRRGEGSALKAEAVQEEVVKEEEEMGEGAAAAAAHSAEPAEQPRLSRRSQAKARLQGQHQHEREGAGGAAGATPSSAAATPPGTGTTGGRKRGRGKEEEAGGGARTLQSADGGSTAPRSGARSTASKRKGEGAVGGLSPERSSKKRRMQQQQRQQRRQGEARVEEGQEPAAPGGVKAEEDGAGKGGEAAAGGVSARAAGRQRKRAPAPQASGGHHTSSGGGQQQGGEGGRSAVEVPGGGSGKAGKAAGAARTAEQSPDGTSGRKQRGKAGGGAAGAAGSPLMIKGQLVVELPPGQEGSALGLKPSDQWVQCDRCSTWRLVPNKWWKAVQQDEREEWYCEYAQWDVKRMLPNQPPCSPDA